MGLGFALSEELEYTPDGRCKNPSFSNYFPFRASEMPEIKKVLIEKGEIHGPWGAKGIAEIAAGAVAPAVVNAINDALGTNFNTLPLNAERVLLALSCNNSSRN
jgi:xanthine dehydrogenase molybdenum-binding subunit